MPFLKYSRNFYFSAELTKLFKVIKYLKLVGDRLYLMDNNRWAYLGPTFNWFTY